MRASLLCAILLICTPLLSVAEDGYIYGDNHCFYFTAPTGWVADKHAGKSQGLAFVFYPADSNWSQATTVIYARAADKSELLKEPEAQVEETLKQFHDNESPNTRAEKVGVMKSRSGAVAELYKFTGDKWGNTELVAYFNGKNTINFFVMTSRDAKGLENSRKALEELVLSYREASDCKPCDEPGLTSSCENGDVKNLPDTLSEAMKLGDQQENGNATRDYHRTILMPYFGNKYAGILKHCFDTIPKPDNRSFTAVVAIDSDGRVLRVYRDLETNIFQCMNETLINDKFPEPPVAPFFLSLEMEFTP